MIAILHLPSWLILAPFRPDPFGPIPKASSGEQGFLR